MAKPFTTREAKTIIKQHYKLIDALHSVIETSEEYRNNVKKSSDEMAARETIKILSEIPVEEINREKHGFRVKALLESGYNTIADLYTASPYSLASVYGISEDAAYEIKKVVISFVLKIQDGIKIHLSIDDKNPASTNLVYTISKYKSLKPIAADCQKLLGRYEDSIESAVEELEASSSGFKWLFSSGVKKGKASDAFDFLSNLINGVYGQEAWGYIDATSPILKTTAEDAWKDFSENSIWFFNILEDINPGILGNNDSVYGLPEDLAREVQEQDLFPDGLRCELRRYQEWGVKYILHQERVLLGDEMGEDTFPLPQHSPALAPEPVADSRPFVFPATNPFAVPLPRAAGGGRGLQRSRRRSPARPAVARGEEMRRLGDAGNPPPGRALAAGGGRRPFRPLAGFDPRRGNELPFGTHRPKLQRHGWRLRRRGGGPSKGALAGKRKTAGRQGLPFSVSVWEGVQLAGTLHMKE